MSKLSREDCYILKEKIDSTINIRDVMLDYGVELIDSAGGIKGMGLCPFHNESNPSFSVSYERNLYNCFSCHASGDIYTFVSEKYNTRSFPDTIEFICLKYGIDMPNSSDLNIEDYKKRLEITSQNHNNTNVARKREEFDRILVNVSQKIRFIIDLKSMSDIEIREKFFPILRDIDEIVESDDYDFQELENLDNFLDKRIYDLRYKQREIRRV